MKKIALLAVAAASICASSAFAQVSVGVPGGPGITIDDGRGYRGDRWDRERDFRRSRNEYRGEYRDNRRYMRDRDYDRRDRVYIERD